MSVAAGIDVGNSSTEVVLARLRTDGLEVIGAGRVPTRRAKGSAASLDGAVALVRRLEREYGVRIDRAVVARLRPVETRTTTVPEPATATGRLRVIGSAAATAGGHGFAVGRPWTLGSVPPTGPVIAVVPAGTGYQLAVQVLRPLADAGLIRAVLLADDEAVLVANRLGHPLPVIDEVDVEAASRAELLAVEVASGGLQTLTDPLRLVTAFGLAPGERADAARLTRLLHDCGNAVVGLSAPATPVAGPVGLAEKRALTADDPARPVDDLWTVDLSAVAEAVLARRIPLGSGSSGNSRNSRAIGLAALHTDAPPVDPSSRLGDLLGVPVVCVTSEARAAWYGGISTPGVNGAEDTVVIDIGGGTVDIVSAGTAVIAAGAGQLLTAGVAALAGTTLAAAEWVKRGPAQRVEAPQLLLGEDGIRRFLDRPAPAETIGALVVPGPAGLLPFGRSLSPAEWRALRLRLKVEALGGNVVRALRTMDAETRTVVVVGGPAGDEEVLSAVARALPDDVAIGRGNVGGAAGGWAAGGWAAGSGAAGIGAAGGGLGHRYAVAYGLLSMLVHG